MAVYQLSAAEQAALEKLALDDTFFASLDRSYKARLFLSVRQYECLVDAMMERGWKS